MEVYRGTLTVKKLTSKMVVYGNDDLSAQYVPKSMFKSRDKHPASLIFTLTIPDAGRSEGDPAGKPPRQTNTTGLTSTKKDNKNTPL